MDDEGYDSDGDLVLSLVPGLAEGLAETEWQKAAAACRPSQALPPLLLPPQQQQRQQQQQNHLPPPPRQQQHQQHQHQRQERATSRPLSPYNRARQTPVTTAAAAAAAPFPVASSTSSCSSSSSFALPSSAKAALEELRVSLDPRLVTHPTGHALLPALSAAGVRARVGVGVAAAAAAAAAGGGSGGEDVDGSRGGGARQRQVHALGPRWRTVMFFRRRRRRRDARASRQRRRRAVDEEDDGDDVEDDDDGDGDENGNDFEEEQVPFVLVCLTASDFVKMVDRAWSEKRRAKANDEGDGTVSDANEDFDPGSGLDALAADASRAHAGCTLGVVVEGLEAHCVSRERADEAAARRGGGGSGGARNGPRGRRPRFVARRYDARLLAAAAAVRFGGAVRVALVADAVAAAEHVVGLCRALAEQPLRAAAAATTAAAAASPNVASLLRTHGGGRRGDTQAAREALLLAGLAGESNNSGNGGNSGLCPSALALARALSRVPGVGPAAAIAVAAEHGSFGALMRFVEGGGGRGGSGARGGGEGGNTNNNSSNLVVSSLAELRTRTRAAGAAGPRVGPAAARRIVAMLRCVDGGAAADW